MDEGELGANTDPQRDSILTKGLADVLDHAGSDLDGNPRIVGGSVDIGATITTNALLIRWESER